MRSLNLTDRQLEAFSKRLRRARHLLGYTQVQMAEELDLSERQYVRLENAQAEPQLGTLQRMAKAFNTTPMKLATGR